MAVIVSDSRNPAYDGNLSTSGSWYRAEYAQLHGTYLSNTFPLSTERICDVTFANSGSCLGVAANIAAVVSGVYREPSYYKDVRVILWQIAGTATMTIASPCVVTKASHGLIDGDEIRFTTSGALPTGITAGTHYFVKYIDANTFNISLTAGGTNINTSGTQSGTHTLYVVRNSTSRTSADICDNSSGAWGGYLAAFKFSSGYAVDTTVSKWQISLVSSGTGTGDWNIRTATNAVTYLSIVVWCDNQVTASSGNDALVIVDKIRPDIDFTLKPTQVPTGGTTSYGVCGWVCSTNSITNVEDYETFYLNTSPVSAITLTIDGMLCVSAHGVVRFGKSTGRINNLTITCKNTATYGTAGNSGFSDAICGAAASSGNGGIIMYGDIPTGFYSNLTADVNVSATTCTVDDASGFAINDTIAIGGRDVIGGSWTSSTTTISNIVGNTITFSPSVSVKSLAGGRVTRLNSRGWGIKYQGDSTSTTPSARMHCPGVMIVSGVWHQNIQPSLGYSSAGVGQMDAQHNSVFLFEDCLFTSYNRVGTCGYQNVYGWGLGLTINRCHFCISISAVFNNVYASSGAYTGIGGLTQRIATGDLTVTNCYAISIYSIPVGLPQNNTGIPAASYTVTIMTGNFSENCATGLTFGGKAGSSLRNNTVVRCARGIWWGNMYDVTDIGNNSYERCTAGMTFTPNLVILRSKTTKDNYGSVTAPVTPIELGSDNLVDLEFANYSGSVALDSTYAEYMKLQIGGTKLALTNDITNEDRTYQQYGITQRCGDGLTDTTVHTAASDKYSIRFENTDGLNGNSFQWSFKVPTGNIQNKDMIATVWCKINSANYYSSSYQLPRLTVNYDNGTTTYAQATAATTWQQLIVPFAPATTYGEITVALSCLTDATTPSNRYVYWDDISMLYPAGYTLNLGGLDLWANGLPITPPIATSVSALDVWAADPAIFGTGTVGDHVYRKLLTNGQYLSTR